MIITIIAWCFLSTGGWYDVGPRKDQLREKGYTECQNMLTDEIEVRQVVDYMTHVYRPYDNIVWSNGNAYGIVEPVDLPPDERLRCDWRVRSYLDQDTYEWVFLSSSDTND